MKTTLKTVIILLLVGMGFGSLILNPALVVGQATTGGAGAFNPNYYPPVMILEEQSAEPGTPANNWTYLDDGTNCSGASPCWRRYTGAAWEDVGTAAAGTTFIGLTDTPGSYTTGNAIYTTNGTPNAVIETTVVLTEGANTFNITKGTATLDIAAAADLNIDTDLTVNTASVTLDQSLSTTSAVTFDDATISTPINIYALDHDSFSGFVANEHINHTLTLTAGDGLTGGGDITVGRTFTMGTPGSLTASTTDAVTATSHTHAVSGFVLTDGITVLTPSSDQSLAAGDSLTVANGIMRLKSNSGAVTSTADPFIVSPASDGTCAKLQGVNDTDLLTIQDESVNTGSELELKNNQDFTFGIGDMMELCYDSGEDKWYELYRSDN